MYWRRGGEGGGDTVIKSPQTRRESIRQGWGRGPGSFVDFISVRAIVS